jgi:DNA replication protein DnaC
MLLEQTLEKLARMKLHGLAKSLRERTSRTDHADLSHADFIGLLVDDEWAERQNRQLTNRLRLARFKDASACPENLDYQTPRGLKKTAMLELLQNRWVESHQNIVITGPSGSGKSYVAQAMGNHLCRSGLAVAYFRVPRLALVLTQVRADGSYLRFMKRLGRTRLLILDDFGIGRLTDDHRTDVLEIFEERYGQGATIITSQLPTSAWHEYLGGGIVADGICDRFLHNAHRIELNAKESLRKPKAPLTTDRPSGKNPR